MKLLLYYPKWSNRWIPYIKKELSCYDLTVSSTNDKEVLTKQAEDCDVLLSMWANEVLCFFTYLFPEKKIISYLRRYELFYHHTFDKILWNKVDSLIFVNNYLRYQFYEKVPYHETKTNLIYNGLDLSEFKMDTSNRTGEKIAIVCNIHAPKNINLAVQILLALPKEYKIYHIGGATGLNVPEFKTYLDNLGLKDRFIMEGKKKSSEVIPWMADKDFILSTSTSEGNPMNVLEGMAMGLKPIVHRWPGAEEQFEDFTFDTVRAAVNMITSTWSRPELYRSIVRDKYSIKNYKQLHKVINGVSP